MTEREKEILTKAADILYSLSCRVDSKMEEYKLEKLVGNLYQVLEDHSDEKG